MSTFWMRYRREQEAKLKNWRPSSAPTRRPTEYKHRNKNDPNWKHHYDYLYYHKLCTGCSEPIQGRDIGVHRRCVKCRRGKV